MVYRYPGQVLELRQLQGTGSNATIPAALTEVGGSGISITVDSNDEVIVSEGHLYFFDSGENRFVRLYIYRDSTEIASTLNGVINSASVVAATMNLKDIDRPGPGTYTYSLRTSSASDATATVVQDRCWFRVKKMYLPESILEITSNSLSI